MIKNAMKKLRGKWHIDIMEKVLNTSMNSYSLMSALTNETLCRQGAAKLTADYKYYSALHRFLNVKDIDRENYSLVRIGRPNDGGYVTVKKRADGSLSRTKTAYSLGINDDVSFDLALAENGYEVFQFDHTIDALPEKCDRFHWRKLGIGGNKETEQLKSLETVLKMDKNDAREGMLLKCDIEGSEWDMLSDCSQETLALFDQIIIEFHDLLCFEKREKILSVLKKLQDTHQAVHLHANNNDKTSFTDDLITPNVLEVTFVLKSAYSAVDADLIFPTEEDQPCNPDLIDIPLGRWNVTA